MRAHRWGRPARCVIAAPAPRTLTPEQKSELYHRGFVIIRNAVPLDIIAEAKRAIAAADRAAQTKSIQAGLGAGEELMLLLTVRHLFCCVSCVFFVFHEFFLIFARFLT